MISSARIQVLNPWCSDRSISDMTVPAEKKQILADAEEQVELITKKYRRGMLTEEERYKAVVKTWFEADDDLTEKLINGLDNITISS